MGGNCRIGRAPMLKNCVIDDDVEIHPYVVAQDTRIGKGAFVGPFARLRQKADVGPDVHIGNFVELKNTSMAAGSKANHLAYLGDTAIGKRTNVGAGTITCNYDGVNKHRTEIEEGVFVRQQFDVSCSGATGQRRLHCGGLSDYERCRSGRACDWPRTPGKQAGLGETAAGGDAGTQEKS